MKKTAFLLIILALALGACGAAPSAVEEPASAPAPPREAEVGGIFDEGSTNSPGGEAQAAERLVITNADISVAVPDPAASMDRISAMAVEMGGFVVASYRYTTVASNGAEVPQGEITIRVPAERFNEAMERIRLETDKPVINEQTNSQDVTREYTDLNSRLRNLEAAEAQLQEIMDQATRTEDVLAVYDDLVATREQIEVIKGQIQYYEESARLSSIRARFVANEAYQPLSIGSWEPEGVAKDAVQALLNAVKFLGSAGIWIVLFVLPVLLLLAVPVVILVVIVRKVVRRSRKMPQPPPAQA